MYSLPLFCLLWALWLLSLVLMLLCAAPLLCPAVWRRLFSTCTVPMQNQPTSPAAPEEKRTPTAAPDTAGSPAPPATPLAEPATEPEPATLATEWAAFCAQPLEAALQQPFPAYAVADDAPDAEAWEALASRESVRSLRLRCMNIQHITEVAERFQAWAAGRPDGTGLLLEAEEGVDYWVAGDVHASFELLLRVWEYVTAHARKSGRKGCLVLLGDIIDRGMEDFPCLAMIEELLMSGGQDGVRLICLRGNHDAALWQDPRGNFHSYVLPAETMEALNDLRANGPAGAAESIGRAAIALARTAPVLAELTRLADDRPEACVLLAHGGLPHVDLQEAAVTRRADFTVLQGRPLFESLPAEVRAQWAEDFTWIRLVDRLPHKKPNRGTHGNEMGTKDVNTYRLLHLQLTGRAIGFIIRGHDHEPAGYRLYSYDAAHNPARGAFVQKNCGVLTLNTMEYCGPNPLFRNARPALARMARGGELTLYPLPTSPRES